MKIRDSRVLVTGASSGIGAALARLLAEAGATVGGVARRTDRLEEVMDDCRRHTPASRGWTADLGDLELAEHVVREAWELLGPLDILINNAAVPDRTHVCDITPESLAETLRIDFESPVRMTLTALALMRARGGGLIVNISSLGGRLGIAHEAAYCAAKFALCGFSEAMFVDLVGDPVDVKLVIPGPIDTEIWSRPTRERPAYDGPLMPAADCAAGIVEAIESDAFECYIPDMRPIAVAKTQDPGAFLAGAAAALRSTDS